MLPQLTATLTIDAAGQINLPDAFKRVFGVEPGVRLRAEVTADRIELVKDKPLFPASGPGTGSFNGLHPKSKFLAV